MKSNALHAARLFLALAVALLAGCASVAMMPAEDDTRAKSVAVPSGKANIYVYSNETMGAALTMPVSLDGKVAGNTAAKSYFLFQVSPGSHEIGSGADAKPVRVAAEAGKNYFVWQEVKMGMMSGRPELQLVNDATGKAGVMECKRIQSAF
jgi:uncharacterized protein YceK